MTHARFLADRRGISTTVAFTLATGITVVLVAGLLVSMGAMMEGQERRAVDSELGTIAEGLAVDIEDVARMSDDLQGDESLAMRIEAPTDVAGEPYTITIRTPAGEDPSLRIETGDRVRTVALPDGAGLEAGSISGGTVWIVADAGGVRLQEDRP